MRSEREDHTGSTTNPGGQALLEKLGLKPRGARMP